MKNWFKDVAKDIIYSIKTFDWFYLVTVFMLVLIPFFTLVIDWLLVDLYKGNMLVAIIPILCVTLFFIFCWKMVFSEYETMNGKV